MSGLMHGVEVLLEPGVRRDRLGRQREVVSHFLIHDLGRIIRLDGHLRHAGPGQDALDGRVAGRQRQDRAADLQVLEKLPWNLNVGLGLDQEQAMGGLLKPEGFLHWNLLWSQVEPALARSSGYLSPLGRQESIWTNQINAHLLGSLVSSLSEASGRRENLTWVSSHVEAARMDQYPVGFVQDRKRTQPVGRIKPVPDHVDFAGSLWIETPILIGCSIGVHDGSRRVGIESGFRDPRREVRKPRLPVGGRMSKRISEVRDPGDGKPPCNATAC